MAREGRLLELLVAQIEKSSLPEDAKLSSPGFLLDKVTGVKREVDILIEYEIGTHPVKIILECRDRNSPQDATWIEQVVGKISDIRVDKAIVVSSSGFTKGALVKAEDKKIETRTYSEINKEVIESWCKMEHFSVFTTDFIIKQATVEIRQGDSKTTIDGILENSTITDTIFTVLPDNVNVSIQSICRSYLNAELPLPNPVEVGKVVNQRFRMKINPDEEVFVVKDEVRVHVDSIIYDIDMVVSEKKVPINKVHAYQNNSEKFSEIVEFEGTKLLPDQPDVAFQLIRNKDGSISLGVKPTTKTD